jgi:hypothetical protein
MTIMLSRIAPLLIAAGITAGDAIAECPSPLFPAFPTAVTTYHYDNLRTGWNCNETTLTPANVTTPLVPSLLPREIFGLLHSVTLCDPANDLVKAQPWS